MALSLLKVFAIDLKQRLHYCLSETLHSQQKSGQVARPIPYQVQPF